MKKVDDQEMAELVEEVLDDPAENLLADQVVELTNDLQRTRADFENYRKQVEAQKTQAMAVAKYSTGAKCVPLLEDMDREMAAYDKQLSPRQKSLDKTLKSLGLTKIDSKNGTEFNPDFHEAISVEDEGGDVELISETLRPGYLYDGSVVRVAMVKVKKTKKA